MIRCPRCGKFKDVGTYDSERYDNYNRRRRICYACGAKFRTVELYAEDYKQQRICEAEHRQLVRFVREAIGGKA